MKKISNIIIVILLFMPGLSPAVSDEMPVTLRVLEQNKKICIDQKKQTFAQALAQIGQQVNLSIQIKGDIPSVTKDISFSDVSFKNALGKTLKLYDVQNHAVVYNSEKATITLYIFESSLPAGFPSHEETEGLTVIETLSAGQIAQLIPEEEHKPLTQEQIDQLVPEKKYKPLTQEQIDQLIPEKEHKSLSKAQIDQLVPEKEHKPLTQEQISQLISE